MRPIQGVRRAGGIAFAACVAALLCLLPAAALAQDEVLINDDRLPRAQFSPKVALGSAGALVVAWADGRNGPDNFVDYDIYAVTVRDPLALGSTINRRLNDDPAGNVQTAPDIASSPSGTFLCVWEDSRAANPDIYAVALDSLGLRSSPNLRINEDTGLADQRSPEVAAVTLDRYLVVWADSRTGQSDVYASYRNRNGAPLGANFIVSSDPVTGGSYQGEPALASNPDGLTLVVWLDGREGGSVFGATFDLFGQWIDASGNLIGQNFKINSTTGPQQNATPAVVASAQGFVVSWIDRRLGTSTDPGDVYAQRFGADRSLVGTNVRVNDDALGRVQRAVKAVDSPSGAYLFWEDQRDGFGLDPNVRASRVLYDASAPGPNFRVNAATFGLQGTPGAAWDGRDAFLVAWEDSRNGAPDVYSISFLPSGARRGLDTQLNDDAAKNDQWMPRLGEGPGQYLLTWIDRRNAGNDLFGQWVAANGGRDGTNILLYRDTGLSHAVASDAAVSPEGAALVAAQVTREGDAGEIRGFLFPTPGLPPGGSFWVSDSLASGQAFPAVASRSGEFAVAWIDSRAIPPRIYGQRLTAAGARLGVNHPILAAEPLDPPFALDLTADPAGGGYWLLYAEGIFSDQRLWIVHLDASLFPDAVPVEIATGTAGPKQNPGFSASPEDGRLEIVWQGVGGTGLGTAHHLALTSGLNPLGPVLTLGDPVSDASRTRPSIVTLDSKSVAVWQERRDGNWSIWMQVIEGGVNPLPGVLRVDEDPGQADQLDPGVGMDTAGHAMFVWSDGRSLSSGSDILARVIGITPTAADEGPAPPQDPPPSPPRRMRVGPPRPNPFSGSLAVAVEVPPSLGARVLVFDAQGALVARLHDGEVPSGRLLIRWDGMDSRGRVVASGVYWFVVEAGGERHALRLVHLR